MGRVVSSRTGEKAGERRDWRERTLRHADGLSAAARLSSHRHEGGAGKGQQAECRRNEESFESEESEESDEGGVTSVVASIPVLERPLSVDEPVEESARVRLPVLVRDHALAARLPSQPLH